MKLIRVEISTNLLKKMGAQNDNRQFFTRIRRNIYVKLANVK